MSTIYRIGVQSESTKQLQLLLVKSGFLESSVFDGIYSETIQNAVNLARGAFHLPPNGRVDEDLLQRLAQRAATAGKFPNAVGKTGGAAGPVAREPSLTNIRPTLSTWLLGLAIKQAVSALKGSAIVNILSGYRTYVVAGVMLLVGVAGVLGIDIPSFSGHAPGDLVLEALAFFFLRKGLKTGA